jgi:ABC-type uncharacterized transport system involved in gliding motility auxiliary subunit
MANEKNPVGASRRIMEGANLAVYTLVTLAIAVSVNYFASRYTRHWDLTPNKKYSLSPQTLKVAKGLNRDVTLYVFDRERGFRERRDLLDQFTAASRRITVRYVDPDRDPSLAKQVGVRSYGSVFVSTGDRHLEASAATEEGISNALIKLLKGQKTVYFEQGHGEPDLDSTEREGYQRVKKEIENENSQVKTLVLLQKLEIPSDCTMLVIAGPRTDLTEMETDAIKKYLNGGGRALFMLDPGVELPNLTKLLGDWGVKLRNDLVIDLNPLAQMFGTGPSMPLIIKYGSSPIVQPVQRMASLFPRTRSLEISKGSATGVTTDSLCETSADSFSVTDFNPNMREVAFRPNKDIKGPLTVAVSATLPSSGGSSVENKQQGRFVALGTSLLAANTYIGFQGNRDLFMNMIEWLSAEEDLISIRPKPPEFQHLNLTAAQMNGLLLRVAAVPLVIIAAAIFVWWGRR